MGSNHSYSDRFVKKPKKTLTYVLKKIGRVQNSIVIPLIFILGFIGGNFSALAGSGVDICSFSVLSLLFRISEKVATPTSVVLMAINTCVGFYWRQLMTDGNERFNIDYV